MSALAWCCELGLDAVLLEKEPELGGQLLHVYNPITNYLGVEALAGREMRDLFTMSLTPLADRIHSAVEIVDADVSDKTLTAADGTTYRARAIVIATGVRRRELGITGEREFRGRGILDSGAKHRNDVAGKRVVIVGGGDAALENALILSERAEKVTVVHRRGELRARDEFVERAHEQRNIEFILNAEIASISGDESLSAVEVRERETRARTLLETDHLLIRIGVTPSTDIFREQLVTDENGYIVIDTDCSTSVSGVFAVGDAADPTAPTIAAAVGQGSIAAKEIKLELDK
jgi:thioredoxin reductase (NADPH)